MNNNAVCIYCLKFVTKENMYVDKYSDKISCHGCIIKHLEKGFDESSMFLKAYLGLKDDATPQEILDAIPTPKIKHDE